MLEQPEGEQFGTLVHGQILIENLAQATERTPRGNLTSKTDARSSVTAIGYDDLNRVSTKTYTAGPGAQANSAVQYCYDGVTTPTACASAPTGSNMKGQLTMVSNGNSVTRYKTFDPMGRITSSTQRTSAADFGYTYDLAGGLASVSYPSGKTVNYCSDTAGRMTKATRDSSVIAQASLFWPSGLIRSLQYANGVTETVEINPVRQQITSITAAKAATQLMKLEYGYGTTVTANNGNVMKQTITRGGNVAIEDYGYDELNRLQTAGRTGVTAWAPYTQRYCYDRYGNRALTSGSTQVPGTNGLTPVVADTDCPIASSINNATVANLFPSNRWTAGVPDAVGNIQNDGKSVLLYDVEGRLYRSTRTIQGTAFEEIQYYDGDGRRVRRETKSGPAGTLTTKTTTVYVYDASGALAAEYGTGGPQVTGLRYLTVDHLGSTRLMTDSAGAEVDRHDFLPFGQEWPERPVVLNTLFTGKERDSETGLDYFGARYMSSAQGRFTSPDAPFVDQHASDPQSWNLYGYVRNNPLKFTDPDGRVCFFGIGNTCHEDVNPPPPPPPPKPPAMGPNGAAAVPPNGTATQGQSATFTITVHNRRADIPLGGTLSSLGINHQYISTSTGVVAGMGTQQGVPQSDAPGVQTVVVDHAGQLSDSSTTYTNVDEGAAMSYLVVGQPTGRWIPPINACNTFCSSVVRNSTPHDVVTREWNSYPLGPYMSYRPVVHKNVVVYSDGSIRKPGNKR